MTSPFDQPGDEPAPTGEEWVEYGGELIWALDFTPGGVPIGHLTGAWAVLLPDRRATIEDCRRWVQEVRVLGQLAREELPFRVPAPLGAFPDGDRPAIIRRFIDGIPADLRAGRMQSIRPPELVGRVAAAIHAIDEGDPASCRRIDSVRQNVGNAVGQAE
jgi:hypothetical protein